MRHISIDLRPGITETDEYKAFKFPGGEIHVKLVQGLINALNKLEDDEYIFLICDLSSSDNIMFLAIVADMLEKTWTNRIICRIPYMPYQQADMDFGDGECFSLKTITRILNSLPIARYYVFDPHSIATPALLDSVTIEDNSSFIQTVIEQLGDTISTILSPDAGAYKKIGKLADKIGWKGGIECANKFRDTTNGDITIRLSNEDFKHKNILIIDDICVGGRTFIELAKLLESKNCGRLYLAISHGIFSNGFEELNKYFSGIYTTNSRIYKGEKLDILKIIDL